MVQHVPTRVKQPTDANEIIRLESSIREVSDDRRERKFPPPESAVKVSRPRPCDHDGIEVSSVWFPEERTRRDVQNRNQDWSYYVHESNHVSSSNGT